MENWDAAIAEVVGSLNVPFDSHLVIRELAHRNQRRYVAELVKIDTDTPFHQLHSFLGRRVKGRPCEIHPHTQVSRATL